MGLAEAKRVHPLKIVQYLSYLPFFISLYWVYRSISKEIIFLASILVILSILLDRRNVHPPPIVLNLSSISLVIFQGLKADLDRIVETGTEVILILTAIKFLEEKKSRDYLEIYLLILLVLSGGAFFSFGLDFIFGSLLVFFLISFCVILLTFSSETPGFSLNSREILGIFRFSALLFSLSFLLATVIFFILPRTDYPIFSFLNKGSKAKTGISNTIRLGEYSEVEEDDSVLLRVKMERIPERLLYWRRCVLDHFDGNEWKRLKQVRWIRFEEGLGQKVHQIILSEEDLSPYLVGLDRPLRMDGVKVRASKDHTFELAELHRTKIKYEVISSIGIREIEETINPVYLQIPFSMEEKLRTVIQRLRGSSSSPEEVAEMIYKFLNQGEYEYSLDNLPVGKEAIMDFLFRSKRGNCEFFASSMALLCRASGIPSRIVTGFRGGEYNEIGNYYLIRKKDAHAWVEVYIDGKGWVSYDPTPDAPTSSSKGFKTFTKIEKILDSINYHILQLVIAYDLERQVQMFTRVKDGINDIRRIKGKKDAIFLIVLFCAAMGFIFHARKYIFLRDEERILRSFSRKLKKRGIVRRKGEGLYELASRIEDESLRTKAFSFVEKFQENFYKDLKLSKEKRKELKRILKVFDRKV